MKSLMILILAFSFNALADEDQKNSNVIKELRMVEGQEKQNEIKALKTELLVEQSEKRALAQIKKLIKKYRGTPMEADMWFRLAELHMRRAKTERFFEIHRTSETVTSFLPRRIKKASQSKEIRKAIEVYERIRKRFKNYSRLDLVLFNNAFARQQLGHQKKAERLYWQIVKQFKNSLLVPDAHLAIGEINYDLRKFQLALEHFMMIEKYPNSRVYPYGIYKAAWCAYNLRNALDAMKKLEKVVAYGKYINEKKLDSRLDLRKEALRDMSLFYGEVYEAADAVSYFKDQASELDMSPYVLRLVGLYRRHSRFQDVEQVLKELIKAVPDSDQTPEAFHMLVMNYEEMRNREKAIGQLAEFSGFCTDLPAKKDDKENLLKNICTQKISLTSKNLAAKWHRMWKKNESFPVFSKGAEAAYKTYIKHNDASKKEMGPIRGSYADLLYQMKRFREASKEYAMVRLAKPDKELDHSSAYSAIVSLEKSVKDNWNDDDENIFVNLSKYYLKQFPKGEYSLDIRFKKSLIAYKKERYDEAAPDFKLLGTQYHKTEKGQSAQDLYLDILNIKKNFGLLKTEAKTFLKLASNKERQVKIKRIYQEAFFSEVQQFEDGAKKEQAIEGYISFAKENQNSPLAPKAWWNASQLLFSTGKIVKGSNTCIAFSKQFPNDKTSRDCLIQAAGELEQIGEIKDTIKVVSKLETLDPDHATKWLEIRADFMSLLGQTAGALKLYSKAIDTLKPEEKIKRLLKMASIHRRQGSQAELKGIKTELMNMGAEPYSSRYLTDRAYDKFEAKDFPEAFKLARKVVGTAKADIRDKARARFLQAEILRGEFDRQSVKARVERIALVLAIKTEKLEKAQKAFQATLNYGDPEFSVKSLENLSAMYSEYARSIRTMTLPADTPEQDVQIFRQEIEALTIPMEEKGVDTLQLALQAAKDAKLIDGSVVRLEGKINKLNMKETDVPELQISLPAFAGPRIREVGS